MRGVASDRVYCSGMKKILLGVVIGAGIMIAGVACASSALSVGANVQVGSPSVRLYKVSDSDGTMCYVLENVGTLNNTTGLANGVGVSCVK